MKRYWKIVVLVPFIVLCIGTYYIEAAGSKYPDYYLKLQAGDEKEAAAVSLQANYTNQFLTIHPEGSEYQSEQSFWKSLASNYFLRPEIEKLRKEHRQFMRGKNYPASFYEDEKVLGYVEIGSKFISTKGQVDFRFIVSIYDKKAKKSASFEVKVPQENEYRNIVLNDVQVVGRAVKLVTMNAKSNGSKASPDTYPEVHLYKLDLDKKNVEADQVIVSGVSPDADTRIDIRGFYGTSLTEPNQYFVFQMAYSNKKKTSDSYELYAAYKRELFYYDYESGKLTKVQSEPIDDILKQTDEPNIRHTKDELLLTVMSDPKGARVIRYSLADNKVEKDLTIDTKAFNSDGKRLTSAITANNRLYMMGSLKHGTAGEAPTLAIADLDTGGILYEGYVSRKDNKAISNLLINNIIIKQ